MMNNEQVEPAHGILNVEEKQSFEWKALSWLANSKTGLSSRAMVWAALEIHVKKDSNRVAHPRDVQDLSRCMLLLDEVPDVRRRFGTISLLSPVWQRIIERWDDLADLFWNEEGPLWRKDGLRRLLDEILDEEEALTREI